MYIVPPLTILLLIASAPAVAADREGAAQYRERVEPLLEQYCCGCHAGEKPKGNVRFDQFGADAAAVGRREQWHKTLKMLQAGLMPPHGKARPTADEERQIETWIKRSAFAIDPRDPDPGRVTLRRLNRVEYKNTIRDLMGVDFNADTEFPPDDTGHGFDNIGDVLSISPLLLEKYIAAARTIVGKAVPLVARLPAERRIPGRAFGKGNTTGGNRRFPNDSLALSYYQPATVATTVTADHAGRYQILLDLSAHETFVDGQFDYNKCRLVFRVDGKLLHDQEYTRQRDRPFHYEFDQTLQPGKHELAFEVVPLTKEKPVRSLALRIQGVTLRGPMEKELWVRPSNYARFFPGAVPDDPAARRDYARGVLRTFASRAFRRPVDEPTVDRLVRLAEQHAALPGKTFEAGLAEAMTVVLASPRFLLREEETEKAPAGRHPLVDEYALASRLSYFLWSTMPDAELWRLAGAHRLRANQAEQVKRMLADPKSAEFVRHFVGQWLQARAIESVEINARAVLFREQAPPDPKTQERQRRFRELIRKPQEELTPAEKQELADLRKTVFGGFRRFAQFELNGDLRRAMRRETEMQFDYILRNDRSLLELLDCDYVFLNERLARHYEIPGVTGDEFRLVKLPLGSPRGGVLTQGTVLAITSNPDRTSPVKRGLFILDNILGSPPPPPPPDIPTLEDVAAGLGKPATLRETLKVHRAEPLCSSCHNRMDPLGLALENFNALGRFREKERNLPIDSKGQLITGESFNTVQELKHILATERRLDFYRCLTEKMLMYALGRGLEYPDVYTVDEIVARLEKANGRPSVLLSGIIDSVPFQKRRSPNSTTTASGKPAATAATREGEAR